jgi:hypothetical protein
VTSTTKLSKKTIAKRLEHESHFVGNSVGPVRSSKIKRQEAFNAVQEQIAASNKARFSRLQEARRSRMEAAGAMLAQLAAIKD